MTVNLQPKQRQVVDEMVRLLREHVGDDLLAVVLYGPAVHGDQAADRELSLLVVLPDLALRRLARLGKPLAFWRKKGLATPRIFSPALLKSSRDVFPIELMDLAAHGETLVGDDPLAGIAVDDEHLRIQCEREISEKLMRLRERYAADGDDKALRRLMAESFPAFAQVLRGAVRLLGQPVPDHDVDVARAFCTAAGLEPSAFVAVDGLRRGHAPSPGTIASLFDRYYEVLSRSAEFIDRHVVANPAVSQQGAAS